MNVFDYVYGFSTETGKVGIVRADNLNDAIDRIHDCTGDTVKEILLLNQLDNDYGVIVFNEEEE